MRKNSTIPVGREQGVDTSAARRAQPPAPVGANITILAGLRAREKNSTIPVGGGQGVDTLAARRVNTHIHSLVAPPSSVVKCL